MNDFDRILELRLRYLLDPVVASRPPVRRGRLDGGRRAVLTVKSVGIELAADAIPVVEPVVVTLPVASSSQL
ncbi:MAG TPA: hypothetical protein VGK28_09765 [Candidatus Dormibacteraeota bacterium]|jgi:hypothetical protein